MNIALIIIYFFTLVSMLLYANKHGQEKGKYNFWHGLIAGILWLIFIWWALGWRFW